MLLKSKKSQLLVISGFILFSLLLFIYSLETQNTYIMKSSQSLLLDNIMFESCQVGKLSNGSYIDDRFISFSGNLSQYCDGIGITCNLTISKKAGAPVNLSILNYTHYNYELNYIEGNYHYNSNFTC